MKLLHLTAAAFLCFVLGPAIPLQAQDEHHDNDKPAAQEEKHDDKRDAQEQKHDENKDEKKDHAQEQRNDDRHDDHAQEQNRDRAQDEHRDEHAQADRDRDRDRDHRIPDDRFRANFGREHTFRIERPVIVEGQPRFQYGGYWFLIAQPWPGGWTYADPVYIDYVDGGYWVFNPVHPGVRVSINVVF